MPSDLKGLSEGIRELKPLTLRSSEYDEVKARTVASPQIEFINYV